MNKIIRGTQIEPMTLEDINGKKVNVPTLGRWTHLQFRRYSGCVICNLHVHELIERQQEIKAAGIQEILFFQSTTQYLQEQFSHKPVTIIADDKRFYYKKFGVENSINSIANPNAWIPGIKGILKFGIQLPKKGESPLGLPADFLLDDKGIVVAVHYGQHAYDQWSVDQLIQLVANEGIQQ